MLFTLDLVGLVHTLLIGSKFSNVGRNDPNVIEYAICFHIFQYAILKPRRMIMHKCKGFLLASGGY